MNLWILGTFSLHICCSPAVSAAAGRRLDCLRHPEALDLRDRHRLRHRVRLVEAKVVLKGRFKYDVNHWVWEMEVWYPQIADIQGGFH